MFDVPACNAALSWFNDPCHGNEVFAAYLVLLALALTACAVMTFKN